ncbi:MAG: hypothetical protein HQM16_07915 [Deltaproteobacteria bacterium]|nr:hypothetical protein [Deltaproteobacteria bacterium]
MLDEIRQLVPEVMDLRHPFFNPFFILFLTHFLIGVIRFCLLEKGFRCIWGNPPFKNPVTPDGHQNRGPLYKKMRRVFVLHQSADFFVCINLAAEVGQLWCES